MQLLATSIGAAAARRHWPCVGADRCTDPFRSGWRVVVAAVAEAVVVAAFEASVVGAGGSAGGIGDRVVALAAFGGDVAERVGAPPVADVEDAA
jgi:hypothetical protein